MSAIRGKRNKIDRGRLQDGIGESGGEGLGTPSSNNLWKTGFLFPFTESCRLCGRLFLARLSQVWSRPKNKIKLLVGEAQEKSRERQKDECKTGTFRN